MNFTDAVGWLIRNVIRTALSMPANSVRPANQTYPVGSQSQDFATVYINMGACHDPNIFEMPNAQSGEEEDYALQTLHSITASVNFYRAHAAALTTDVNGALIDAEGVPAQSSEAYDKALRLGEVLQLPPNRILLQQYGLGFIRTSPTRDLTGVADSLWENRAQVDITFDIVDIEATRVAILQAANITLQVAQASGPTDTVTIEVTP